MSGPVRLADVAKAAGVSLGTASNAFNRPERVRAEVRARVHAVAEQLGYSGPDPKGRLLMGGRVNAIGVLIPTPITTVFEDAYLRAFMAGAAEICGELSAALVIISAEDEEAATRGVKSSLVDGFILHNPQHMGTLIALAKARRLPFVAIDAEPDPSVNSINLDSRGGAREAARHLIALGHRRFAIMSLLLLTEEHNAPIYHPPSNHHRRLVDTFFDARERWLGYGDAMAEAGLSLDEVPVVEAVAPSLGDARVSARMLLDAAPDATAVLCMSDGLALAVIEEAKSRGIRVPRDLSVVGFDDVAEAAAADPPLTTVAQSIRDKGRAAARAILEPPAVPRNEILPVRLVVRASTAPPRT